MKKIVVFVNGRAGAGKDTAIAMMRGLLMAFGWVSDNYSSIDPVRELLARSNIDVSQKTDADRDLLAEIGTSLEMHSSYRTEGVAKAFRNFTTGRSGHRIMFVSIREHKLMLKMKARLEEEGAEVRTLFVDRNVKHITSNSADAECPHPSWYEFVIDNNGTFVDLAGAVAKVADKLVGLKQVA
ncbi:hypothetical protein [Brucella intermedia]|uniref:hypothetical protein n=1 Tax=Brucella intermedia TaxID=94625 RepID=UPI00224ADF2B|nr:hypothetical protein [Brucella intermedia]